MYSLHLLVPALPKSLNKSLRSHWGSRHSLTQSWGMYLASETAGKRPPAPLPKAELWIVRHSYRSLDFDGLVGSMKPVVDGLVRCGVLKDDSWKVLGAWHVDQKYRAKNLGDLLEIRVEES
jgi:hypothetical protein